MVSLLSRGVAVLVKSLVGLNCTQATRCSSLPSAMSTLQHSTPRWFSKSIFPDETQEIPLREGYPKRPLSSFFHYLVDQRPLVKKKFPEAKVFEISKIVGLEWKGLSESDKKPYIEAANAELLNYKDEIRKFKEKLTPLELDLLKRQIKQKLVKRKHNIKRRELTLLGKPKGYRTAFNIFMSEHFQDVEDSSFLTKMKTMHDDWRALPTSQKQMYIQLAEDDRIRYENEMKSWEEAMLEIGRADLLRLKIRKRLDIQGVAEKRTTTSKWKVSKISKQSSEKATKSRKDSSELNHEE